MDDELPVIKQKKYMRSESSDQNEILLEKSITRERGVKVGTNLKIGNDILRMDGMEHIESYQICEPITLRNELEEAIERHCVLETEKTLATMIMEWILQLRLIINFVQEHI